MKKKKAEKVGVGAMAVCGYRYWRGLNENKSVLRRVIGG